MHLSSLVVFIILNLAGWRAAGPGAGPSDARAKPISNDLGARAPHIDAGARLHLRPHKQRARLGAIWPGGPLAPRAPPTRAGAPNHTAGPRTKMGR